MQKDPKKFKAGFVSIVGRPNAGKSTLMNALVGENLSIITAKAQTTRHRIMGILTGEDFQIVYSDTPGIIDPQYELHKSMMKYISSSLEDADVILWVIELGEKYDADDPTLQRLVKVNVPIILLLNKIDLGKGSQAEDKMDYWKQTVKAAEYIPISALDKVNTDQVFKAIINHLPVHAPYYDEESLTDRPERFFAAEIIREKIFMNYKKEVPYSCEVVVNDFIEDDNIIRISAMIFVERDSQKGIIIGKGGEALKKVGSEARKDMEVFFQNKVFLETRVKVEKDWRKKEDKLNKFGYGK